MSEFDKEAERERLREKYERDQEDREAAQQMSDLLLKGATMTNAHCGECGSPIFRQNGQEFCPTCGARAEDEAEAAGDRAEASGDETGDAQQADAQQPGAQRSDARPTGEQATDGQSGVESPEGQRSDAADRTTHAADPAVEADAGRGGAPARRSESRDASATDNTAGGADAPAAGDAVAPADAGGDAAAALQRALLRHARAADTADPRIARDHLAAAREAAEALAALRQ